MQVAERTRDDARREALEGRTAQHAGEGTLDHFMAADTVTTTVTELPESRVRVQAEVAPKELERRLQETARELARDMRMPGFRKGKVPPPVVIRQLGRPTVLDETVRGQIGRWYVDAVETAGIHPVGEPELDLGDLPEAGAPLTFTIEIGVRPVATLGTYEGIQVGRREPKADDEAVQGELDQLREQSARLEDKEGPAELGDFVTMDFTGYTADDVAFPGGEGRDQVIELGSGRLIPGFEDQVVGAVAGEDRSITVTFPEDYHAEDLKGQTARFELHISEVKHKQLPELDDEFASDQAGFDSLEELRDDIAEKLVEAESERIEGEFREAVVDAVVQGAEVEVPDALIEARSKELWDRMIHTLSHQGINKELYLQISGKSEEEVLTEGRPDAEQALRREAVIAAVVDAEKIDPSEGDELAALQASAVQESTTPEKLRARLIKAGRLEELREDLAQRQAVDFLAEHAQAVDVETARQQGLTWTPDAAEREADGPRAGGRTWLPEPAAAPADETHEAQAEAVTEPASAE